MAPHTVLYRSVQHSRLRRRNCALIRKGQLRRRASGRAARHYDKVVRRKLAQTRAFANTPVAKAILFVMLLALVGFGVQGVSHMGGIKDTVVEAGGRSINSQKFRHYFDSYKKQIEEQQGQPIPLDELMKANGITDPKKIQIGQQLKIPASTAKKGK